MSDTITAEDLISGKVEALAEEIRKAQILIVDDMALMRQLIGRCLSKAGFTELSYANDGDEALQLIEKNQPDLVILDLNMPKLSGFEVCKSLRANSRTSELPILVQSASEAPEERVEVFAVGATDFVSKPINQPELLARVCMHLENRFLIRNLSEYQRHIQSELVLARDMQESLLPQRESLNNIEEKGQLTIESFYQASFELGGDLWGGWPVGDDRFGFYLLDIAGHGVGAALNTFRIHATMERYSAYHGDPARFLTFLNNDLVDALPTGQFATMFYGVLDLSSGKLTFSGAGAPRPLIVNSKSIRGLDTEGIPLGITKKADYENKIEQIQLDESLLCYSDVLIEAPDPEGTFLGEKGFVRLVLHIAQNHPREEMVSKVLSRFFEGISGPLPDDLTAVGIHRGIPRQ